MLIFFQKILKSFEFLSTSSVTCFHKVDFQVQKSLAEEQVNFS